jgi:hypothetical protein
MANRKPNLPIRHSERRIFLDEGMAAWLHGSLECSGFYAVRFSGPVTALTARRVRYGDLICQPGPAPGIKTHSSPAAFPSTLSLPFSPWTLYPPARASGRCRAPLAPCQPPRSPQNRYDAASGKNVAVPRLALIRSTPRLRCLVDRPTRASTLDNDADEAPGVAAGRR